MNNELIQFSKVALETKGASFVLTRRRDSTWNLTFPNLYNQDKNRCIQFSSISLENCAMMAKDWLIEKRKIINPENYQYQIK